MKYLKLLTSESDYNEYRHGDSFSRPNVTLCKDNQSLIYKDATYDLTINYIYSNGQTASSTFIGHYLHNENYSVVSPTINGFKPNYAIIKGTMPENDLTLQVMYITDAGSIDPIDDTEEPII